MIDDNSDETDGRALYRGRAEALARSQVAMAQRRMKMLEKVTPEQLSAAAINVADQMVRENGRLRQALQKSLTAMTLASCFDAVTAEYDFSHAIAEARAALSRPERGGEAS